jgi:excisionase family DNA binding protein
MPSFSLTSSQLRFLLSVAEKIESDSVHITAISSGGDTHELYAVGSVPAKSFLLLENDIKVATLPAHIFQEDHAVKPELDQKDRVVKYNFGKDCPDTNEFTELKDATDIIGISYASALYHARLGHIRTHKRGNKIYIKRRTRDMFAKILNDKTVADAAKESGVTAQTILNWIHDGKIKAAKFGATYRIPNNQLKRCKNWRWKRDKA